MLGGDIRTPARLVRWIEIYNAGASEIPAFGATEITGEEQPESGGTLTPAAGRTVLQVQRPRCDSAKKVVFNGQTPLGVGKYGWGTMDMPAWALSETTTNGNTVGTEEDSFILKLNQTGFVVLGGSYEGATRVCVPVGLTEAPFYIRNEYSSLTSGRGLELGQLYSAGVVKADIRSDRSRAYAILIEDIDVNVIGRAKVTGWASARVSVGDVDHTHCYLPPGDTVFKSNFGGPLELLQTPTSTGSQDLLVRWQPLYERKVKTAATISAGSSGSCDFYINGSVKGGETVYFNWMENGISSVASGKEGVARWFDDEEKWCLVAVEC